MATSSKRAHAISKSAAPRAPVPVAVPADPYLHRRHSTQFCLSLCGILASWFAQGLFEPPEHLWWEWGLILNANLPLLPSCLGFSFALGHRVSPHSCSSTYRLTGVSLTLDVGYLLMAARSRATQCRPAARSHQPSLKTKKNMYVIVDRDKDIHMYKKFVIYQYALNM